MCVLGAQEDVSVTGLEISGQAWLEDCDQGFGTARKNWKSLVFD